MFLFFFGRLTACINYWLKWSFRDPKMEVLYHISGHILLGYSMAIDWLK